MLALLGGACPAGAQGAPPLDPGVERRVDAILARMTLEEKVGQMTQLTIQAVSRVHGTATQAQQLDSGKLEDALVRHHVGALLNVWDVALTPAQWRGVIDAVQRTAARTRLRIPVIYGIDAVHGQHYMVGSTVFPQNLAMAATWDPALVRREHEITAYETRATGITWNFAPVLDLGRQPLWSRFFETFGEDPYLASVLGAQAVRGEQSDPRPVLDSVLGVRARGAMRPASGPGSVFVAATGKHFLGYSFPLSGKDRTTAWIPQRQLREYFLPSFRTAVDSGVTTLMANSGDINGIPVHSSHRILTDLLRGELGFRGIVDSDWEDIIKLHTVHRVAATESDAVRMAVMAGVDMSMVPQSYSFYDELLALVRSGAVPVARIDQAVRRILRVKLELGLFGDASPDTGMMRHIGAPPFAAASRAAAEEAVTLLKNDGGLLPLRPGVRVLVTGPGATSLPAQYGAWSYTWQGTDTAMYPRSVHTLLAAIRAMAAPGRVTYVPGASFDSLTDVGAAVSAARHADVVVVALAEWPSAEQPGNIDDLTLPAAQLELARRIEATGVPVVLTIFHDRPRVIHAIVPGAHAVVAGYETGPFGGDAVAGVLFGSVNPSGRLPFSWPRATGAIEHYDRAEPANVTASAPSGGYDPEWPFGFGLSYTTFAYSSLHLDRTQAGAGDTVTVSVTVANTGTRAGTEVVQLYSRELYASVDPPLRRLRAFQRVALRSGERRTIVFHLPIRRLAFVGRRDRPVVEPGNFDLMIADQTARLTVR